MAFVPCAGLGAPSSASKTSSKCTVTCSANRARDVSRRSMLAAAAAAVASKLLLPNAVNAGGSEAVEKAISKVFFPKEGFNAGEKPLGGSIDRAALETASGKAAVSKLRKYQTDVDQLYTEFKNDPQVPISKRVGQINISELRDTLNVFGEAFDEDAQRETDRIVRNIIQDIGELQAASVVREGAKRTELKIRRTTDWFDKLTSDFGRLVSFLN